MAWHLGKQTEYAKLEQQLVLLSWLNRRFGFSENAELLDAFVHAAEGFDSEGRSFVFHQLRSRGSRVQIPLEDLARYDDHIRRHLESINARRAVPITLRYFQHLALLYAEVFLDRYFNRRATLLHDLNQFGAHLLSSGKAQSHQAVQFTEAGLGKLAFWMATGSGKTLLLHINHRQFLHYNDRPLDNILLVTPNEGLTEQHIQEMRASNIPCRRFDLRESGRGASNDGDVRVIEITKLVEKKKGGGESVPIEAFEGNNLIFVDEGHKGSGGVAWRGFRDALGKTGFTFEYSATFGQALSAAGNDDLTAEYGKAIVFDYSYRYFHKDGYGKDFQLLNLREETAADETDILLLGNLLSFYEQRRYFADAGDALRPYHLEKPLWVFVGSRVNAVYKEKKKSRSDVLTVVRFLHRFLENRGGWAVSALEKLSSGRSGLVDPRGRDLFAEKFPYLRTLGMDAPSLYADILSRIFHAPAGGGLHLGDLRGFPGEIGLRAGAAADYFGVIYIGDTAAFKKLAEADDSGIALMEDAISGSLFRGINEPDSGIEMLVGAKKFMEGWNSWRVSNMGLLNIGRKEGSEIIQLFGRGVRLRGMNFSLKRSAVLEGNHPKHLSLLETLNIFAVRANYMTQFREYLEKEGMETEGTVSFPLPIRANEEFLNQGLLIPRIPDDRKFAEEQDILLDVDPKIQVRVDMALRVEAVESRDGKILRRETTAGKDRAIPPESLSLVDWDRLYLELLEYKERNGMKNLAVPLSAPRDILAAREPGRRYRLVADDTLFRPASFAGLERLHEAALTILRKYMDKFYRDRKKRWESEHMEYRILDETDPDFQHYTVNVLRNHPKLIQEIEELIRTADLLYRQDLAAFPSIHFDRHLYQPLLVEGRKIGGNPPAVRSEPPGLKESERRFVDDLRMYCRSQTRNGNGIPGGGELFLLRNLSRGKGVGFFGDVGFYPDFILWIKRPEGLRILFVEPHGMVHAGPYRHDDKAKLHETLPALGREIARRTGETQVSLDSFIVSATPYEDLRKTYDDGNWDRARFRDAHILFPERDSEYDYVDLLLASAR